MIAENGIGQIERLDNDTIHDDYRIDYIREHIIALNKAITRGAECFLLIVPGRQLIWFLQEQVK